MNKILNPNCSETVSHLGIKKSEIPYIIKRVKELAGNNEDNEELLKHFNDWVKKTDGSGDDWISEGLADKYNTIKDELLAKRHKVCPFCKEEQKNIFSHIRDNHKEEIKLAVGCIDKEEYNQLRKEIIVDEL